MTIGFKSTSEVSAARDKAIDTACSSLVSAMSYDMRSTVGEKGDLNDFYRAIDNESSGVQYEYKWGDIKGRGKDYEIQALWRLPNHNGQWQTGNGSSVLVPAQVDTLELIRDTVSSLSVGSSVRSGMSRLEEKARDLEKRLKYSETLRMMTG